MAKTHPCRRLNRVLGLFLLVINTVQAGTWLDLLERDLYSTSTPRQFDLHQGIERQARQHRIAPEWLAAIVLIESAADPCAVSHVGAAGLMQLMPQTARTLGVIDRFNPQSNLAGGADYLAQALKQTNGNIWQAAAMYNAGPGVLKKPVTQWPTETKNYVNKHLLRKLKQFKQKTWRQFVPHYIPWTNSGHCQA